jgi:hypothetical protein
VTEEKNLIKLKVKITQAQKCIYDAIRYDAIRKNSIRGIKQLKLHAS